MKYAAFIAFLILFASAISAETQEEINYRCGQESVKCYGACAGPGGTYYDTHEFCVNSCNSRFSSCDYKPGSACTIEYESCYNACYCAEREACLPIWNRCGYASFACANMPYPFVPQEMPEECGQAGDPADNGSGTTGTVVPPVDKCAGISCAPYCSGKTLHYSGVCDKGSGGCTYEIKDCPGSCSNGQCVSVASGTAKKADGASCGLNTECESMNCVNNTCTSAGNCAAALVLLGIFALAAVSKY